MKRFKISMFLSALLLSASLVNATSLQDAVNNTLKNNPEIQSIIDNNRAYRTYVDEFERGFYPRLDLEIYGENKQGRIKEKNQEPQTVNQDGYNAKIQLEQLLYDGGLTPARMEEAKYTDLVNQFNNKEKVETVLLNTVKSYLDLIKYDERLNLSKENIKTHEGYLITAKDNEAVTSDALDTHEVTAKLHLAKKNYIEEVDNSQIAKNSFKRLTGMDIKDSICMPNIDRTTLPVNIESLVNQSIKQNNRILSQIAKISEQRAIINQEEAKFLPTITAQLNAMRDHDLIEDDTQRNIYSARLVLEYNLYNGGKDTISKNRERIFLQESQKILDSKTELVVDEITSAYHSYTNMKSKIDELKGYVVSNENILRIYKDQFQGGSRTFVDVLDIETDLYNARVQLIDAKIDLANLYFVMVSLNSELQNTILNQPKQVCSNEPITKKVVEKEDELTTLKSALEDTKKGSLNISLMEALKNEFKSDIENGILEFNTSTLTFRFKETYSSMPIGRDGMLVMTDEYKNQLDNFIPRLINTIKPYEKDIEMIALNGYASSPFLSAKNKSKIYELNLDLSKKRAEKVLDYVKSIEKNTNILELFKAFGKSHENVILKANGDEDIVLSKRVEFIIK